jgi:tRNA threonylcarbamoyl adenosine modification protein (Sua5/YciO/YrdC/YwlC family)
MPPDLLSPPAAATPLTDRLLRSWLRCRRRAWLDRHGPGEQRQWNAHRALALDDQLRSFQSLLPQRPGHGEAACAAGEAGVVGLRLRGRTADATPLEVHPPLLQRVEGSSRWGEHRYQPVLARQGRRLTREHRLLLALWGRLLAHHQQGEVAQGLVLAGSEPRLERETLALGENLQRQLDDGLLRLAADLERSEPPPLVSDRKKCTLCSWRSLCDRDAAAEGHLSEVSGIGGKRREMLLEQGVVSLPDLAARDPERLAEARTVSPLARRLAAAFWPGPLTLVLTRQPIVPDAVTAGLDTVGVRVPAHPVARALIAAAGIPIAAPSANAYTRVSPTTAAHVVAQLGDRVELVLDGGPATVGIESTVVDVSGERPVLLRPGGIAAERIEALVGPLLRPAAVAGDAPRPAPGMVDRHYAPRARLQPFSAGERPAIWRQLATLAQAGQRVGLLAFATEGAVATVSCRMPADADGYAAVPWVAGATFDVRVGAAHAPAPVRRFQPEPAALVVGMP